MRLINYQSILLETLLGKILYTMISTFKCILFFLAISSFSSCSFWYRNKTRILKTDSNLPNFKRDKNFVITSILVLDRRSYDGRFYKYDRAKISSKIYENSFDDIIKSIEKLNEEQLYKITFADSLNVKNDSIFKILLTYKNNFYASFDKNDMQKLDFSKLSNGLHIVVSVIKEMNTIETFSTTSGGYIISLVFDFFDVYEGKLKAYTSILRVRSTPFNEKRWKPIPRDTRRVFKKLCKQKE